MVVAADVETSGAVRSDRAGALTDSPAPVSPASVDAVVCVLASSACRRATAAGGVRRGRFVGFGFLGAGRRAERPEGFGAGAGAAGPFSRMNSSW